MKRHEQQPRLGALMQQHRGERGLLLALDTSTRSAGVALYDGVQVLCENTWTSQEAHTTELAPAVADALRKAGCSAADLGAIGVALGPGSFTGLRIGLALAKGLALAQQIPLIGIPTLDILAAAQPVPDAKALLAVVLRAGRGRLAVGWYEPALSGAESAAEGALLPAGPPRGQAAPHRAGAWQTVLPVEVLTPEQLAEKIQTPTLVCGELGEEERLLFTSNKLFSSNNEQLLLASPAAGLRRAGYLAELAWARWQTQQSEDLGDDPAAMAPIYLHYNEPIPG
jgi:tRNA threonylcarbamoyladenosine biosynthesis protein TsaB